MTTTLRIPGVRAENTHSSEFISPGRKPRVKVTQKAAVQIDLARGAGDQGVVLEIDDDDVLELELEGGLRLWTSFHQFQLDFPGEKTATPKSRDAGPAPGTAAAGESEPQPFPVNLVAGGASRGVGGALLRAVRVLDVDLPEQTALGVAALLEKQLRPGPGLFRWSSGNTFELTPVSPKKLTTEKPLLIFIHGTASSSSGSFGELWEPAQRAVKDELFAFYGEHIYALEHRTLTESPVQNALQLLEKLPPNARLHLVSHSRGGLVGELVCLGQRVCSPEFDPLAPEVLARYFPDAPTDADADAADTNTPSPGTADDLSRGRRAERQALTDLAEQLKKKQPRVERFVRVACPARGTTLASGRLDRWLSTMVNVLALAGLKGNPAYALVMDFVLAVAKQRTDPRTLPGLEAQMPESPLVKLLNREDFTLAADLTVIAGDAEATDLWGRMKLLLPDLFYGEDHDLIVNTRAMYGGAARSKAPRYFMDQGSSVNHFHYFKNRNTTRRLIAGLTRPDGFEAEFSTLTDALRRAAPASLRAGLLDSPVGPPATVSATFPAPAGAPPATVSDEENSATPKILVTVAHGDLAATHNVVAVGHYRGDAIVSAESYLDQKLDGRLRERERLGLYPGKLETTAVFLKAGGTPGGAVVIGLGEVGDLTAGDLSRAFAHGLLRLAVAVLETPATSDERRPGGSRGLRFSTLLIGTGEGGLAVAVAMKAILEGVASAGAALRVAALDKKLVLEGIEFIELHEDHAIQAAQVLVSLRADRRFTGRFDLDSTVIVRPGGRRRARVEEPPGWWDRLEITRRSDAALKFVVPTRRARVDVELVPTQIALVDQFIHRSISSTGRDPGTARALFELLLPNDLKDLATAGRNLLLLVDEAAAAYPWELLENRADTHGRPPAVAAGLLRQLAVEDLPRGVNNCTDHSALVVGNPQSELPDLPGAAAEARLVAQALDKHKYEVSEQTGQHSTSILTALYARDYRILHLAGHGVYDQAMQSTPETDMTTPTGADTSPKKFTGMVLGHGVFLTPAEVRRMRQVPELVFINCCHLGRIEDKIAPASAPQNKLAANLATEFIRGGVRAVVAAGWAVNDAAAMTFATIFYREMLSNGATFGDAVRMARAEVYSRYPEVNTWGAYQCYGDPNFRLRPGGGTPHTATARTFTHPREVVMEAENLAGDVVRATTDEEVQNLKRQLACLEADTPDTWLTRGDVCAALARAAAELGQFPQAIALYQRVLADEYGSASFQAAEQLSNLEARQAVVLFRADAKVSRADARRLIRQASTRLNRLLLLGKTTERLNLLGSLEKRRALISRGPARKKALAAMQKNYQTACDQTPTAKHSENFYSSSNALLAELLLTLLANKPTKDLGEKIEQWRLALEARHTGTPPDELDFWAAASLADGLLLQSLATGTLASTQTEISKAYQNARAHGATLKQTKTIEEHLDFIATILATARPATASAPTVKLLRLIRATVTA